jgi:iron complex transport system substrate-binding protein
MNRFLRHLVPILLSLALFMVSACTSSPKTTTPASITITDQAGRTVTLPGIPQRIVSIAPANTEILFALGLSDRVVAVTDFCTYPPEATEKPSIGGFYDPNIEEIIALSPDLVLAAPIHEDQIIPQLETRGITVLAITPENLDEVLEAVNLIGKVTGVENKAAALVKDMQQRITAVTKITADLTAGQRPTVLYLVWHDPLYAAGANTFHDELIRKAGGVNMVTEKEYPGINMETVISTNPDIILAGIGMGEGGDAPLIFAQQDSRLRDVSARKNNRVYGVNSELVDRAGPRIVDALEEFARLIHPELFK